MFKNIYLRKNSIPPKKNSKKSWIYIFLCIFLMSALIEDNRILTSTSLFNLLQYVFWLKYMQEIWPHTNVF